MVDAPPLKCWKVRLYKDFEQHDLMKEVPSRGRGRAESRMVLWFYDNEGFSSHPLTERWGWKGPLGAMWSKPLLKQGHLEPVAQDHVHKAFEYLQGRKFHNISGKNCISAQPPSQLKKCFFMFRDNLPSFSLVHWINFKVIGLQTCVFQQHKIPHYLLHSEQYTSSEFDTMQREVSNTNLDETLWGNSRTQTKALNLNATLVP